MSVKVTEVMCNLINEAKHPKTFQTTVNRECLKLSNAELCELMVQLGDLLKFNLKQTQQMAKLVHAIADYRRDAANGEGCTGPGSMIRDVSAN